jgi:hypothetical protein
LVLGKKLSTRKAIEVLKNLSGNVVLVFENENRVWVEMSKNASQLDEQEVYNAFLFHHFQYNHSEFTA